LEKTPTYWFGLAILFAVAAAGLHLLHVFMAQNVMIDCQGEGCFEQIMKQRMAEYWPLRYLKLLCLALAVWSLAKAIQMVISNKNQSRGHT